MKNIPQNPLSEQHLDDAAAEALGANTPADSAAYQQQLAAGEATALQTDASLRETVAQLAAASPFMQPSPDLRGKILQATAPTTFRMEDYRKATRDTGRFFRWGFAAAMLFLAAGAYYNMTLQSYSTSLKNQLTATVNNANTQLTERNIAINNLVSPKAKQVNLQQDNKVFARAYVNDSTKTAVLLIPEGLIPAGKSINQLTLTGEDGKPVAYTTVAITTSREAFPQVAAGDTLNAADLKAHDVQPDPNQKVFTAQMH